MKGEVGLTWRRPIPFIARPPCFGVQLLPTVGLYIIYLNK